MYIKQGSFTWQRYVVAKSLCERNPALMRLPTARTWGGGP